MINIVVQLWNKLPGEVVSANSVSALILRLNSMHVSFLMFCFTAVCLFSLRIFRAVLSAFWAYLSSSALYCFYCTVSVLVDKIFLHSFIHSFTDIQFGVFLPREALASHARTVVRECCKGDDESQWERVKFDPPPPKNPLTDGHQNLHT